MLFVASAMENATLEDTLPAVEPSRVAAMWEDLSGTVDPYITILLLVQTDCEGRQHRLRVAKVVGIDL